MRQVLAWAMEHDPALALRLAAALGWWWLAAGPAGRSVPAAARGRRAAPSRAATGGAPRSSGSAGQRSSRPIWPGRWAISPRSATPSRTGRRPGRWPTPWPAGRRSCGTGPDRRGGRRCPPRAGRWPGRSATRSGRLLALADLSFAADYAGDHDEAVRLARQAGQITAGIPGLLARACSYVLTSVLTEAGDLAAAERVCAAGLARARDAGDLWNQAILLPRMVDLDLRAGRPATPRRTCGKGSSLAVRTGSWLELRTGLSTAGTCAPRPGAPPRPSRCGPRAPRSTSTRDSPTRPGSSPAGRNRCARPGRRSDPAGRGRPRSAARR